MYLTELTQRIKNHQSKQRVPKPEPPQRPLAESRDRRIRLPVLPLPPLQQLDGHEPDPLAKVQIPDLAQFPAAGAAPTARRLDGGSREEGLEESDDEEEGGDGEDPLEVADLLGEEEAREAVEGGAAGGGGRVGAEEGAPLRRSSSGRLEGTHSTGDAWRRRARWRKAGIPPKQVSETESGDEKKGTVRHPTDTCYEEANVDD